MATVLALLLGGCGSGGASSSRAGTSATSSNAGGAATIAVSHVGGLGQILVDGHGRTLYLFGKDRSPTSSCYGACASAWPPVTTTGRPRASGGASSAKLSTTRRKDGSTQVLYDGHPLYYYAADGGPGSATGQGLDQFGGLWYVLSPAGSAVRSAGSSAGSGGYGSSSGGSAY